MSALLSVVMPVYNEEKTLEAIVAKVQAVPIRKELLIVNDCSTDTSAEIADALAKKFQPSQWNTRLKVIHQPKNMGKGAAIRTGFAAATGDILIVQDADLEYDPGDYPSLIQPILDMTTQVVYGSRRLRASNLKYSGLQFYIGGVLVTWLTNLLFGSRLTDEPTCYKVFTKQVIANLTIVENGFAWEPEITAKLLRQGQAIIEVPIHYYPRHVDEGKKINWKDGIYALWTLIKYRFRG